MTSTVNPEFLNDLKKFGNVHVEDCFNCGNCTAICPLSTGDDNFPRRMIRYAQLGLEDQLISSKELWLCYYCGECTETCPREADPGEFMATARRYAISKADRIGLAKLCYTTPIFNLFFLTILAVVFAFILLSQKGDIPPDILDLFAFIPSPFIHNTGIVAGVIVAILALSGIITMTVNVSKKLNFPKGTRLNWGQALWDTLWNEVLLQKSYVKESKAKKGPWYLQRWFLHGSVMWGFMGLFLVTAVNYLFELLHIKETGTFMPVWHPIRFSGIISGLLMVYGSTMFIVRRLQKHDATFEHSTRPDWFFLILMWLSGVTGFALDVAIYLPTAQNWGYWVLIAHLIVIGELLLLAPFSKFSHAVYRVVALYTHALKPLTQEKE